MKANFVKRAGMVLISILILTSCEDHKGFQPPLFTLNYQASEGGIIEGESNQQVLSGHSGTEVTAVADDGFRFVSWSDGLKEASRSEKEVMTNYHLTANFEQTEFTITYKVIKGHLKGEAVQKKQYGEYTDQVVAFSDIDTIYNYKWSDGWSKTYRSDLVTGDATYVISFDYQVGSAPALVIDTDDKPVTSKINYVDANYSIIGAEEYNFSNVSGRIRGRGNSTWNCVKKPYRLKFDKKVDLFGMGKAKNWVLLANYQDPAMIRNYGAFDLARKLGLAYTNESQFIEVYLNDEFLGLYQLTEQVEINENRVLGKKENEFGTTDGPYLIELDGRASQEGTEGHDWFRVGSETYAIKSPDTEEATFTQEQFDYIKNYFEEIYRAMETRAAARIEELVDIDSFIDFYLVQEIYLNSDAGFASFYMYKDVGGRLTAGPVWDFDRSAGNTIYDYNTTPIKDSSPFYRMLFQNEGFKERVKERLRAIKSEVYQNISDTVAIYQQYQDVFDRDCLKWVDVFETFVPNFGTEITSYKSVSEQVIYFSRFMTQRLDWLYANIDNF